MWVVDNDKDRSKTYLKNDLRSNFTGLADAGNRINGVIAAISRATAGMPSGMDQQMIGDCQRASQKISEGLRNIEIGSASIDRINTRVWVDDEQL